MEHKAAKKKREKELMGCIKMQNLGTVTFVVIIHCVIAPCKSSVLKSNKINKQTSKFTIVLMALCFFMVTKSLIYFSIA